MTIGEDRKQNRLKKDKTLRRLASDLNLF